MPRLELLFFLAAILYTTAIWADRLGGKLKPWMIWTFGAALSADTAGTILLCATVTDAFRVNVHTLTGAASLVIMAAHFAWALLAVLKSDRYEARFRRWSLWAWGLWLVSFFSGAFFH